MSESDYVVVRRGPDMPDEWSMPPDLEGKWFDRSAMPMGPNRASETLDRFRAQGGSVAIMVAEPTGRFEVREDDGAVAEVFELRPSFK